ncbi:hypothetical protein G210_3473 [Candida maltosa Xu316]|uniref:Uncharacterized protein n=1 Tax=Candida maltosa (strain Xu316) TaxID=1245528 RepID=M3JTV1_CANMX|nr:hypothetical protein G210_3473 [Candida maltosa Xu316]
MSHLLGYESPEISQKQNEKSPTRFLLAMEGLEVFIYNRTFAYDNIIDILEKNNDLSSGEEKTDQDSSSFSEELKTGNLRFTNESKRTKSSADDESRSSSDTNIDGESRSLFFLLQVLPIGIRIKRGAVVIGNSTTPSIMVASFKVAGGTIDVAKSPNTADRYRILYDCAFDNFQLWMRPNMKYEKYRYGIETHEEEQSLYQGQQQQQQANQLSHIKKYKNWFKFQKAANKIQELYYRLRRKDLPTKMKFPEEAINWRGLRRYIGDTQDDSEVFAFLNSDDQYAKYSLILDSVTTRLIYYYDNPGIQPMEVNQRNLLPPECGVEVEISMGTIHYGPWTDRQRVPIQNMLFPPIARDSTPTRGYLDPGTKRDYNGFRLTVIVKDEVILRIPTRESSKDKELLRTNMNAPSGQAKTSRPFGWLEIKLSEGSNIGTFNSYVADKEGWPNIMKIVFSEPEIRSSVNHDVLFVADSHEVNAKIGFPLEWNGKCEWDFDMVSLNPKIFFLREHTMLFSDLFSDFGSGEPQPYEYFRPFIYNINWKLLNYKLYLNANDLNIVDNPLDFENNKYLSFQGEELDCDIKVPLNGVFTKSTTIPFNISTPHFDLILDTPPWHSINAFLKESNVVGRSNHFVIDGLYTFFSSVEVNTSDYVEIRCLGDEVSLKFYGFVIRYLFAMKDNYFGDHIHFKTFEEYTNQEPADVQSEADNFSVKNPNYWKMIKTENDMDVFFTFQVRSGLVLLPYHTYSCKSHIGLNFDMLDIDIRFCNYYMDMQVDFSPISAVYVENYYSNIDPLLSVNEYAQLYFNREADMCVDGFSVHTHRMFGVPPEELTYYCKWDFSCGDWIVDSHPMFIKAIAGGISNFGVGFSDSDNALDVAFPPAFDAANFSFKCPNFIFKLRPDPVSCVELHLVDLLLSYNDMSNRRYSNKLVVSIPKIHLKVFNQDRLTAFLNTSLVFTNICQKHGMLDRRKKQQEHVRNNDAPYHRSPFILLPEYRDNFYNDAKGAFATPLSLPQASIPLTETTFEASRNLKFDIDADSINSDSEYLFSGRMPPTNDYNDKDFTPSYEVDPDTEYDNLIVELGDVDSFCSPKAVEIIIKMLHSMEDYSMETIIDELNVYTVKMLQSLINSTKEVKNCRIVSHELSAKFGDFDLSDSKELPQVARKNPTTNFQISDLSVVLSEKVHKMVIDGRIQNYEELAIATHIKDIIVSVSQPYEFNSAVLLNLQEFEFWMEKKEDGMTGSLNLENTSFHIDDAQTEWLADYIKTTAKIAEDIGKASDVITRKINASACLVHALSLASVEYYIDHDPDVLTKPAYILRAKKEHIRFFDSWKVVARLRHILQHVPEDWKVEMNKLLQSKKYPLRKDGLDQVLEIFSRWRAWEANPQERATFFNRIFSRKDDETVSQNLQMQFIFGEILVKLISESHNDYVSLQRFSTTIKAKSRGARSFGVKNMDIVIGLGNYGSNLTTLSFDTIKLFASSGCKPEKKVDTKTDGKSFQSVNINLAVSIESLRQQVSLPSLIFELQGNTITSVTTIGEEMEKFSHSLISENLELNIWGSSQHIFSQNFEDMSWVVGKTTSLEQDAYEVDFELEKLDIHLLDKEAKFTSVLEEVVKKDIPYIEGITKIFENKSEDNDEPVAPVVPVRENSESICLRLKVHEINFTAEYLNPLVFDSTTIGSNIKVSKVGTNYMLNFECLKGKYNFDVGRSKILEIETSDFVNAVEFGSLDNLILLSVDSTSGYAKAFCPNLIATVEKINKNLPHLESKVNEIQELIKQMKKTEPVEQKTIKQSPEKEFAFKVQFSNNYVGLSTFFNKAKVSFEIESTSIGVYNVAQISTELTEQIVPVFGDIVIPAARLSILEKSIPIGLSNLLDVNLAFRLLCMENLDELQTLQFESQYCRICLSEPMLFKLMKIADEIGKIIPPKKANQEMDLQKQQQQEESSKDSGRLTELFYSKVSSFQCLAYNFCLGWLFDDKSKDYPGIIAGAERFFVTMEPNLGKFTLLEAYFSVANGNRSSNFYSTSSEKFNLNRAFLPNLQLSYSIDKGPHGKHMRISMHGDELDVKFLSSSVAICDKVGKSASSVQAYLKRRSRPIYHEFEKDTTTTSTKSEKSPSFKHNFDSIEYTCNYAGSNVLIYRLEDGDSDHRRSLFLHAPAVKMAFKYTNNHKMGNKDTFVGEFLATSSDNMLYPECVPVIADLVSGMKGLMRKSKKPDNEIVINTYDDQNKSTDFFRTLLGETDIHFGVRVEKQALSLSCEPTAKVAAIVGLDGIFIQLNTMNESKLPAVSVSMLVDSVSVLLQHIYSRDISASAGIKDILFNSTIEFGEVATLYSSGSVSDADAYVNVKQYQDVDLFKDIWFPKEYSEIYSSYNASSEDTHEQVESPIDDTFEELGLAKNKNISSRFKEVSTTYAFPWIATFVVANVGIRVDFGQSLGNFELGIENVWAVSKKSVDWSQDLKLGIREISLSSVGRLGGNLSIKHINLHTAISWKLDSGLTLDVPLILVSGGVQELQLKMSFDHHVIAIGNFEEFSMDIYNKKSEVSMAKDHLFVTTKFKTAEVYLTSLTASNFLDIKNTISRMIQDNQRSYKETLRDSSKGNVVGDKKKRKTYSDNAILETVKKLETRIHVTFGNVLIHVYPSSINDDKVLVINLDDSRAKFQQNEYGSGISNELDLKFNDLKVSLSSATPLSEDFINEASVTELTEQARKAKGGSIFVFPSFRISMRTFQKYNSNLIEYMFQSTFNGTVDIRWNLGSVNFIREMYSIHTKALESRMEYRRKMQPFEEGVESSSTNSILHQQLNAEDTTQEIDDAIKETIEKVEKSSKYNYVALAPPIIEAPQLKELGNATPPLEWFGLHRNKLPHVTHQLAIVSLQKLIHEIELEYSKMLGKA